MAEPDARRLRGLPPFWEQSIPESALDGLRERAYALATWLESIGRKPQADELRRRATLLERADELHRHASDVETVAGLYCALSTLAGERQPAVRYNRTWLQAGMLEEPMAVMHGPAFRETAALRNRAYRWLAEGIAHYVKVAARKAR
jgi:hypothetical protein